MTKWANWAKFMDFFINSIFRPVSDFFVPDLMYVSLYQYSLFLDFFFHQKFNNFENIPQN